MSIVKGKKLMLFIEQDSTYRSIGFCTSHTFNTSASTIDVSHKDLADVTSGGKWQDQDLDSFEWSIDTEAFYANTANGFSAKDIMEYYINGTVLNVKFGLAATSTTGVPVASGTTEGGWTPSETLFSGKVIISNLTISAPTDDNATMSLTMSGKGPITLES